MAEYSEVMREWISVKDSLPKESKRYIIVKEEDGIKYVDVAFFSKRLADRYDFRHRQKRMNVDYERPGWWNFECDYNEYEVLGVTHWMPLPEPPKENV